MAIVKRLLLTGVAILATAAPVSAADRIGDCELSGAKGSIPIANTATAGQLTVQVSLPAPIWWNGDKPETIKDGMEYCMAAEIAWRAGYDKLKVVGVEFEPLVTGKTTGFDLSLSEISITDQRKKLVDFSIPYFNSDIGVLARADAPVDESSIKEVTVGIQQATTGAAFATETLGLTDTQVYADRGDMLAALRDGEIDAVMTDTSIMLAEENGSNGKYKVIGQYKTGETYGAIYQKGSANAGAIDKIIQAMIDDGTMKKLGQKYLAAAWGKDPATVPYFKK